MGERDRAGDARRPRAGRVRHDGRAERDVNLNNGKVLLEFASGQITHCGDSELSIAGATAFLADATGLTSNSALTGLSTVTG